MKKYIFDFLHRGFISCGFGPVVLAIIYVFLNLKCNVQTLTVNQVCSGIFSLSALAFVSGGMNAIYQIEQLPLMVAIFIHGSVLYVSYLVTYLFNNWLKLGKTPIIVFSAIFIIGYLIIWIIIYSVTKTKINSLNKILNKNNTST